MIVNEPATAIVVRIPVPVALKRLRRTWDAAAGAGVPDHVTILFPFLPPDRLASGVRDDLARIAALHEPFDVRFARIGRWPELVYLVPDPSAPFIRLTDAVVTRYPDYPPYGGSYDEVVPHLTVVGSAVAPLDEIAGESERHLPFGCRVTHLEVLVQRGTGAWRRRWRIPLGRPTAGSVRR